MEKCKECEYCMRCAGELTCTDGYNENYDHHIDTIKWCERVNLTNPTGIGIDRLKLENSAYDLKDDSDELAEYEYESLKKM